MRLGVRPLAVALLGTLVPVACGLDEAGQATGSGGAAGSGATPSTGGAPLTGGGGSTPVGGTGGTTGGAAGSGGLGAAGGSLPTGGQGGDASSTEAGPDATPDVVTEADAPSDVAPDAPFTTQLQGARIELPCKGVISSVACSADQTTDVFAFEGQPGVTYSVTLRFRGVVEQTTYAGGVQDGYFYTGGTVGVAGWNTFSIKVASPAQTYWLNAGAAGTLHCFLIDYTRTIKITGGANITLNGDALDGQQVRNFDGTNKPIVVPEIPPAPAAYDGQFVYIDVISIVPS